MLFRQHFLDGILVGEVTLAFRRWQRPSVRPGTRLRTAIGLVAIDEVEQVDPASLTASDAHAAGFASLADLEAANASRPDHPLFRIRLHYAGPDPRIALREDAALEPGTLSMLRTRLERLDRASPKGPWTTQTLRLIVERPATRAADLAASAGRDTPSFKLDVRKLKNLGLTESLGTGYRISPRGEAYLASIETPTSGR
ncbi:MAG TPA: hypothetical protein VFK32_03195 [Tepidiformaceae bacterium]|nr:hypothetical protein [Tepidiformaceae bacterium]